MLTKKNDKMRQTRKYRDVKTVESQWNDLVPEEFPDGPYGSIREPEHLGKTSPWRETQHASSGFTYENREFHEGIPRQFPGSHPTHDE